MPGPVQQPPMRARPGFRQVKGGGMNHAAMENLIKQKQHLARVNSIPEGLEGDIADTSRNHLGVYFRYMFCLAMLAFILAMMFIKLQGEFIEPPNRNAEETAEFKKNDEDITSQYFSKIQKERQEKSEAELRDESEKARAKRRKAEQQEIKEAYEEFQRKRESGECDEACKKDSMQIELLHDQVSSIVNYDYYKTLDIETGFGVNKAQVREKFEEVKKKVEEGDPDYDHLDLAEVDEAYSVIMNNEARMFYNMYGRRPPAIFKAHAGIARHGGWGQEFMTSAWKTKKLLAWMEHFDNPYVDLGILALIAFFTVLPIIFNFRNMMKTMRQAFPDLDPDMAQEHVEKMAALRSQTFRRPARGGKRY